MSKVKATVTVTPSKSVSSQKSKIPVMSSCKKSTRARPAPNFAKLHQKWKSQFEAGKAVTKKACTVPYEFEVTKPGSRFQSASVRTYDEEFEVTKPGSRFQSASVRTYNEEFEVTKPGSRFQSASVRTYDEEEGFSEPDFDFVGDQKALESILSNRGVTCQTGRATIATTGAPGRVVRSKSCSNLSQRRILGELPCDPEAEVKNRRRSRSASKPIKMKEEKADDFEVDESSLHSILSNTGIQPIRACPSQRQTFAAQPVQKRCSIFDVPRSSNLFDSCVPGRKMEKIQMIKSDRLQEDTGVKSVSTIKTESVTTTKAQTPTKACFETIPKPEPNIVSTPMSAVRVKSEVTCEMTPQTPSRLLARKDVMKPLRQEVKQSPALLTHNMDRLRPRKPQWESPFGTVVSIPRRDSIFPEYKRVGPFDSAATAKAPDVVEEQQSKQTSSCFTPRRILKTDGTFAPSAQKTQDSTVKKNHHVRWADSSETDQGNQGPKRKQLFSSIQELEEAEESKENVCPITKTLAVTTSNQIAANVTSSNQIRDVPLSSTNQERPGSAYDSLDLENGNRHQILSSVSHGFLSSKMAMHTESESETEGQRSGHSTRPNSRQEASGATNSNKGPTSTEAAEKFVGRVKKNRKRQSVAELNESISESHVHLQNLQGEVSLLQLHQQEEEANEGRHDGKTNILYNLELIKQQREQLLQLQKQLQDQLITEAADDSSRDLLHDNQSHGRLVHQSEWDTDELQNRKSKSELSYPNNNYAEFNNNVSPSNTSSLRNGNLSKGRLVSSSNSTQRKSPVWKEIEPVARTTSLPVFLPSTPTTFSQTVSQSQTNPIHLTHVDDATPYKLHASQRSPKLSRIADVHQNLFVFKSSIVTPKPNKSKLHGDGYGDTEGDLDNVDVEPPIWTPLALRTVSKGSELDTEQAGLSNVCVDSDSGTPLDLSVKRKGIAKSLSRVLSGKTTGDDQSLKGDTTQTYTTTQSAFRTLNSCTTFNQSAFMKVRISPIKDVGSLSLKANSSPAFRAFVDDSCRSNFLLRAGDRYQDALLDDECELYLCRLQRRSPCNGRGCMNPIARVLTEGDEMHFIPIKEEAPFVLKHREGSAFCCFSP